MSEQEQEQAIPIHCHDQDYWAQHFSPQTWRAPDEHRPFRYCSYCGSMHPLDLKRLLEDGKIKLSGSDWKYGWPHKFYIDGIGVKLWGKWYNTHLHDLDGALFAQVAALLDTHTNILFERKDGDGRLHYRAPHAGYQKW